MNKSVVVFGLFLTASIAFAQSDRGTITGTVSDPAGAVVPTRRFRPGTSKPASCTSGRLHHRAITPSPSCRRARIEVSVTVPGFKKYTRAGLTVQVAQTLRIDVALEVGSASESVTVTRSRPAAEDRERRAEPQRRRARWMTFPFWGSAARCPEAPAFGIRTTWCG